MRLRERWRKQPEPSAPDVTYRARPYVCGAIGRFEEGRLDRLKDGSPTTLREVHRSSTAVLFASAEPEHWRAGHDQGFFWSALATGEMPTSWQSAAERRAAAGLQYTAEESTLHTDALGMQDLYTRRLGDALNFSVRIDPLLRLSDTKLHTDWTAWASILAINAPLADTTPFEEVRRLTAATAWRAGERGLHGASFEPHWLSAEPNDSISASEAVATIAQRIPDGDLAVTLSGGWDSRLLAMLARRRSDRIAAWTTSDDDGRDRDLEIAAAVAKELGIEHHTVVPSPDAWFEALTPVRRRLEFQTPLHVWFMPLARVLQDRPGCVLDGVAGDTLLKGSRYVPEELAATAKPTERHRLVWDGLAQRKLRDPERFAPGVAAELEARSRESFVDSVTRFDDHHAADTLSVLHTRTARALAVSPQRLLSPEARVNLPFIHADVIAVALGIPPVARNDGVFYREMLSAANSHVAGLPSTNDGEPKPKRGPRRQSSPAALRVMARTIRSSEPVFSLLGTELGRAVSDADELNRVGGSGLTHRILNWASLLAEWRTTHGDILGDDGLHG